MHLGIIAPEFPPQVGGMPAYARGLTAALRPHARLTVYTMEGFGDPTLDVEQRPVLTRDVTVCERRLAGERVDAWYALNAGHAVLARSLRAPMLATFHGNDFLNPWLVRRRPWLDRLERARGGWRVAPALRRALHARDVRRGLAALAHVVTVSQSSARLINATYPGFGAKISVVPPGVEDRFFGGPLAAPGGDGLRLLTVARLERWSRRKNVDGVLRALARLPAPMVCSYTIVGDGDDRGRLEALARDLGVAPRVTFAGRLDTAALLAQYAATDLFVLASRAAPQDVEGFGIVYLEAAACGVPSICSEEGGATDAVEDGVTGIVIRESSPEAIAAGISRFAAARGGFDAGRIRGVAERFRWPHVADAIVAHIAAATGRRR